MLLLKDGWYYTDHPGPNKHFEPYRNKFRFSSKPETVVEVMEAIPKFAEEYNEIYEYNKRWVTALLRARKDYSGNTLNKYLKMKPMKHQVSSLYFSLSLPACGLFLEPGLGKTYIALNNIVIRKALGKVKKALVICPKSVMNVGWGADCSKFTDLKYTIIHDNYKPKFLCPITKSIIKKITKSHLKKCKMTQGDYLAKFPEAKSLIEKTPLDRLCGNYDVYITSPEQVKKYRDYMMDFDIVILDESTMIKNPNSQTSKAIHEVGQSSKYRIAMTGTPMTNRLEDLWSQMFFLDQSLGSSFNRYINEYFWVNPKYSFIRNPKSGASEIITSKIQDRVIVFKAEDCLDLPERVFCEREVPLSSNAERLYGTMNNELFLEHDDKVVSAKTFLEHVLKLQQLSNGFIFDNDGILGIIDECPPKVREVRNILGETDKKAIIWTVFRRDVEVLMENLKDYNPVYINSSNVRDQEEIFKNNPDCRVAIVNPKSCKFGHTWNWAEITIYYSLSFSVEDYKQSVARNYRTGQTMPVTVYILLGSPVDQQIWERVKSGRDFGDNVLEDMRRIR